MSANYFKVNGGNRLSGTVSVSGAKNSVLALLVASVLTDKQLIIEDVPSINDVYDLVDILEYLGSNIIISDQKEKKTITIDNSKLKYKPLLIENVTKFRASYYFMGAMIGRFGKVDILIPGGCFLGPRPIDLHIKGFEEMGCSVKEYDTEQGPAIEIRTTDGCLKGNTIFLDFPSVGATINLLLASALANGNTLIENAAKEPEIIDVITMLSTMGANIRGGGTGNVKVEGVEKLEGCFHQVIPDRIEAGCYILLASLLGNNIEVTNIIPEHLEALLSKLTEVGISFTIKDDSVIVHGKSDNLNPISIKTGVYPSFPTDLQQVMCTFLTQIEGESKITEKIYPDRFRNCYELINMGAAIDIKRSEEFGEAIIQGGTGLDGKEVSASDLRAGFSLIFAGLIANGETKVDNINHVLRGYDRIIEKLQGLGASIELIEEK
ncbi:MAG: UDP-N-acetylglucosamine 1-carboxyvinyltransferase [Mycoplasmatales bacterium]